MRSCTNDNVTNLQAASSVALESGGKRDYGTERFVWLGEAGGLATFEVSIDQGFSQIYSTAKR